MNHIYREAGAAVGEPYDWVAFRHRTTVAAPKDVGNIFVLEVCVDRGWLAQYPLQS